MSEGDVSESTLTSHSLVIVIKLSRLVTGVSDEDPRSFCRGRIGGCVPIRLVEADFDSRVPPEKEELR